MTTILTVTKRGEVTLDHLGVKPGENLVLKLDPQGSVSLSAAKREAGPSTDRTAVSKIRSEFSTRIMLVRPGRSTRSMRRSRTPGPANGKHNCGGTVFATFDRKAASLIAAQGHAVDLLPAAP